ncbi:SDR family NAD(P)-dependent oxidoreductase [Streptomyces olivaceoviridis]|uniref:SDR family NAD(P)-dependent oxidoreductase n=1 Tax=Streptomyces olivaceoviridis TaxID=1921 RepID=UPI0036B84824
MKALIARAYGPLEDLEFAELPTPVPGPGQLLVRPEAVALNRVDKALVMGTMREAVPVRHPFVPGADISGVVEAVGEDVTRLTVGDSVIAWNGVASGGLAEYVLIEDGPSAAQSPAGLTPVQGAALPTGALTADALLDAPSVPEGGSVLVVGATGGVGSYAIQPAKQAGLTVLATGRSGDEDFLRRLGADHVFDRRAVDLAREAHRLVPGGVDAVLDLARTGLALATAATAVREWGMLVSPLAGPPAFERGVTAFYGGTTTPEGRPTDRPSGPPRGSCASRSTPPTPSAPHAKPSSTSPPGTFAERSPSPSDQVDSPPGRPHRTPPHAPTGADRHDGRPSRLHPPDRARHGRRDRYRPHDVPGLRPPECGRRHRRRRPAQGGNRPPHQKEGGRALFVPTHVTRSDDVEHLVATTVDTFAGLHVTFNNAGVFVPPAPLAEQSEEDWDRAIALDLKRVFLSMKHEVAHMVRAGGRAIVDTASIAGLIDDADTAPYVAAKYGVIGLTRAAAVSRSGSGSTPSCRVRPGRR